MNKPFSGKEELLVKACLQNNRIAQKQLYDLYKDAMYTLAFRLLRDEDEACDALQEGFIDVFKCLKNFNRKSTLGAWIKTIILRKSLDRIKKAKEFDRIDTLNIPFEEKEKSDLTGDVLDKAIGSLSPGYRQVFVLIEVEGYTHKEVAEMLNISVGTSKSQLSRAKSILQTMLKEYREN